MKYRIKDIRGVLFQVPLYYAIFSLIYLAPRILTLISHGPFVEPDSSGYRTHSNNFGFTNDLASIDFFGLAFRPFPVNIFYAILPNDYFRVLAQVILGLLAWIFFLSSLSKFRNSIFPKFLFATLLTFSPALVYRDLCILPDSLSLTILIGLAGLYIRGLEESKSRRTLFFVLVVIIAIQRPTLWITLLLLSVLLIIISNLTKIQNIKYLILVLTAASIVGLTYNNNQSHNGWPRHFNTTYDVTKNAFPIGLVIWEDNPHSDEWKTALREFGFPDCGNVKKTDVGPWEYSVRVFGECKKANEWLNDNFYSFFLSQIYKNPALLLSQSLTELPKAFIPSPDSFIFEALTETKIIPTLPTFGMLGLDGIDGWSYRIANNPFVIWIPFWVLFLRRKIKNTSVDKHSFRAIAILAIPITSGIIVNTLVMPSDTFRHNMPANYALLIMSLMLILEAAPPLKNPKHLGITRSPK